MLANQKPVIVSQIYPVSSKVVWAALTQIEQMRAWFFNEIPEYKAEVGFNICFDVQATSNIFPHNWTVLEVIENKRLVTNWNYPGFEGDGNVIFDLLENDTQCTLSVTVNVLQDFDQNIPEFTRESCQAGWEYFLGDRLKNYLAAKP